MEKPSAGGYNQLSSLVLCNSNFSPSAAGEKRPPLRSLAGPVNFPLA